MNAYFERLVPMVTLIEAILINVSRETELAYPVR